MNSFDRYTLKNGIKLITRKNPNTSRVALNLFTDAGTKCEPKAGVANLVGRLLLQGTEKRNAEDLANELDLNAIEMNVDVKQDYIKLKAVCLNEDFDKTIEILSDVVLNSTFADFEKEVNKFSGEIEVDLDSPKTKAVDNLIKTIYKDHPYGHTHTIIMEDLPKITKEDVINYYKSTLVAENLVITVVGDIDPDKIKDTLEAALGNIPATASPCGQLAEITIPESMVVTISKNDAAQAQIIQGWIASNVFAEDTAAISLLNSILGSSGLSSRLFVELRDKKGLAYTVRSSFDSLKNSGTFTVYIGTDPKNMTTALEGFKTEIKKIMDEPVSEKELEESKTNLLGKRAFFHETNAQQAHYLGYYEILGLGADYDYTIPEKIKKVTAQDIQDAAVKYFSGNSVTSVLAPDEYLKGL